MTIGSIVRLQIESKLLDGNRAGETPIRPVTALIPAAAKADPSAKFPVVYLLAPWTSAGRAQFDWKPFRETIPELFARLEAEGRIPPMVVVAPDLYTRYGGSQYIDSEFFGPHGSHIVKELIPFCEKQLPIKPGAAHRAVMGRSSGGFGALRLSLDFPGIFSAAACHSGDLGFELMFGGDLHTFCDKLAKFDGNVGDYLDSAWKGPKTAGSDVHMLMLLGMCGFYSPDPSSPWGYQLPLDTYSAKIDHSVLSRWHNHDPIKIVSKNPLGLAQLKSCYVECGVYDQYHLLYGARQLHDTLQTGKIEHRYEEFKDNHSGTEYRYAESLPDIANAIS